MLEQHKGEHTAGIEAVGTFSADFGASTLLMDEPVAPPQPLPQHTLPAKGDFARTPEEEVILRAFRAEVGG